MFILSIIITFLLQKPSASYLSNFRFMFFHKINGIIAIALSIQPTDILFPFNLLYWFKVSSIYYIGLKYIGLKYLQSITLV